MIGEVSFGSYRANYIYCLIEGGTQRASRKKLNYLAGQYNQAEL